MKNKKSNNKIKETKDQIKEKEISFNCLLNKIGHKPLILTSIYSFAKSRPYILLYLILKDNNLKISLKNIFNKALPNNTLSQELNDNRNDYLKKLKMKDELGFEYIQVIKDFIIFNKNLESIIRKPKINKGIKFDDLVNIFDDDQYETFIENIISKNLIEVRKKILKIYYSSYSEEVQKCKDNNDFLPYDTKRKYFYHHGFSEVDEKDFYKHPHDYLYSEKNKKFFNEEIEKNIEEFHFKNYTKNLLNEMTYHEFVNLHNKKIFLDYYKNISNEKDKKIFLDKVFYLFYKKYHLNNNSSELEKFLLSDFDEYPLATKQYRQSCRTYINNEIENNGYELYNKNIKESIIKEILGKYHNNNYDKDKKNKFVLDYLGSLDILYLFNFPKDKNKDNIYDILNASKDLTKINLDSKYLEFIENNNLKQKICLICIIDRNKYSKYISKIIYRYVYELHFTLFIKSNLNNSFMFNDIPINEIYNIFINYFINIKNYKNIEVVSFSNEFFLNKNQFLNYNDEYYQSIISYLIDQY